jgi:hypothetical protein
MGAEVTTALRGPNGLDRVVEIFDEHNGEGDGSFGMRLAEDANGRVSILETNPDGTDRIEIAAADNRVLLGEMLQTMTGPTAMIGLAERMRESAKTGLETRKTNQAIETDKSVAGVNEARTKLINAQVKNLPEELKLTKAQAALATAKADEIVKSMEGLQPGPKQKLIIEESLEAVAKLIIAGYDGEDLDKAVADYVRNRGTATSGDGYSIEPAD